MARAGEVIKTKFPELEIKHILAEIIDLGDIEIKVIEK